jgi:hypothetical protein
MSSISATYADQDTLVLEVDVRDSKLVRERHCVWGSINRGLGQLMGPGDRGARRVYLSIH